MTRRQHGFTCLWVATAGVLVPAITVTGPVIGLPVLGVLVGAGLLLLLDEGR